jgi:smad nuclear-interacting protein 1
MSEGRRRNVSNNGGEEPVRTWGRSGEDEASHSGGEPPQEREPEPDFGLSGALAAEANTVNGVVLLHTDPPEARLPTSRWRLYVFKGDQPVGDPLRLQGQSRFIFGRERRVADIPTDHPSCSKQHAVLQYRLTEKAGHEAVRPYLMDLGSTNGTFLNGEQIEHGRYYELLEKDLVKFGNSTREYVLLKE